MLYRGGDDPKMSVSAKRQQCAHVTYRSFIRHRVRLTYKVPSLPVIFSQTSVEILMGRWDKQVDSVPDLLNKWWLPQGSGLSAWQILQLPSSCFFFLLFASELIIRIVSELMDSGGGRYWKCSTYRWFWASLEPLMVETNCSKVLNPPKLVRLIAPINAGNRSQQCYCLFPSPTVGCILSHFILEGSPVSHAFKPLNK